MRRRSNIEAMSDPIRIVQVKTEDLKAAEYNPRQMTKKQAADLEK